MKLTLIAVALLGLMAADQRQEREQRIACTTRAALVDYAFWAKQQGLDRDKFHWTSELDDDEFAADTRREVDGVWSWDGSADAYRLRVYGDCMGVRT